MKLDQYQYVNQKKLRCGYTTGSCATAAAKAGTWMLLSGKKIDTITLMTPKKIELLLPVDNISIDKNSVTCSIQKNSGDDPDVTDGIDVYATIKKTNTGEITIEGGKGVGKVSKPGLNQPIGAAAINNGPRQTIQNELLTLCKEFRYKGGLLVIISVPDGEKIAKKTFNPRLGIKGGISILGTTGIVEPMSESALIETIRIELTMRKKTGQDFVMLTLGNYGEQFLKDHCNFDIKNSVKCSNFIGQALDISYELGFKGILLVGHIGKLVKLGAGIMNTHSKQADGRMEILLTSALLAGANTSLLKQLITCVTTEECLTLLQNNHLLEQTMLELVKKIEYHVAKRIPKDMVTGVLIFSSIFGSLGETSQVPYLKQKLNIRT